MKKNFISVLILGCTLINIVLSGITVFSVVTTNASTGKIVKSIAQVLSIDTGSTAEGAENVDIPIEDIETYSIPEQMTISMKTVDGTPHYCIASVFFSINTKHADYKKYSATVTTNELIFKSIVSEVIQQYTVDEARANQDKIRKEILKKVQDKYSGSDFIFDVSFSDIMFQ